MSGDLIWVRHPDGEPVKQIRALKLPTLAAAGWTRLTDDEAAEHEAALAAERDTHRAATRAVPPPSLPSVPADTGTPQAAAARAQTPDEEN